MSYLGRRRGVFSGRPLYSTITRWAQRRPPGRYRIMRYRRVGRWYKPRRSRWKRGYRRRCRWMFRKEVHWNDNTPYNNALIGTSENIQQLTQITQGDGTDNRTGNKIVLKSIYLKGFASPNGLDTSFDGREMRLIVVRWNEDTDLTAMNQIYDSADITAKVSMQNENKFKILYDKVIQLRSKESTDMVYRRAVKFYRKECYPVLYQDSTATSAYRGRIYVIAISNLGTNEPKLHLEARVKWVDV